MLKKSKNLRYYQVNGLGRNYSCNDESAVTLPRIAKQMMHSYAKIKDLDQHGSGCAELAFPDSSGLEHLWIIGGEGGDQSVDAGDIIYYNDVWRARVSPHGVSEFGQVTSPTIPWSGGAGHTATLETRASANGQTRRLCVFGGNTGEDEFSVAAWTWALGDPNEVWRRDFESNAQRHIASRGSTLKLGVGWDTLPVTCGVGDRRVGFSLLVFLDNSGWKCLHIIGGEGEDHARSGRGSIYYNEIWRAQIINAGVSEFEKLTKQYTPCSECYRESWVQPCNRSTSLSSLGVIIGVTVAVSYG